MFYSNCFIQAMKYKILHPFKVKLTYISPKYIEAWCPHWLWSDGTNDYSFCGTTYLKWYQMFWYKGEIIIGELGRNERYKQMRIDRYNRRKFRRFPPNKAIVCGGV